MGFTPVVPLPPLQVSPGNLSTAAPPRDPRAPELLVAINTCDVPPGEVVPQLDPNQASSIEAILTQLWKRLTGGLDHVWKSPDGHDPEWEPRPADPPPAPGAGPTDDPVAIEEGWARWCSELMDATPYGAARSYRDKHLEDADFFEAFMSDNPVAPILMACQQLCTFALLSRGYTLLEVSGKPPEKRRPPGGQPVKPTCGVSAGDNGYLGHLFEGGWDQSPKHASIAQALARAPGGLTPGSIFGFKPNGEGQKQGSHAVFVLRIARSVSKVQFLDTGAVLTSSTGINRSSQGPANNAMKGFGGGNYDDALFDGTLRVSTRDNGVETPVPFVGLGVLKPPPASTMAAAVTRARRARPLGIARLAIFKRPPRNKAVEDRDILYVSPRLPMHDPTALHNFYISRYLWSLRAMPGYQNLQAIWEISIPRDDFIEGLLHPTRDVPLSQLWKAGSQSRAVLWMTVEDTGMARCLARYKSRLIKKMKPDGTIEDVTIEDQDPQNALNPYRAVINRLQRTKPGEDFLSGALQGSLDVPHPMFERWPSVP